MKRFVLWQSIPAVPSRSQRVILAAVRAAASLAGLLAVFVLALPPGLAQADAGLPPGVHVDPGSPAAKEYAIPLTVARQTGAPGSSAGSSAALFGAGVGPRTPGGPSDPHAGTAGDVGRAKITAGRSALATGAAHSVARESLPPSVLAASSRAAGDGGSLIALLAGGVAILILGGLAAAMLRRRHQFPDTA